MNESTQFPRAPARFKGESREIEPGACFAWMHQGWTLFLANPGVWIGSTVLLLVILMAISIVPLFGQISAHLLAPLFGAGMVQICRHLADDQQPEVADLFAGFRHNTGALVMVGVIFKKRPERTLIRDLEMFPQAYAVPSQWPIIPWQRESAQRVIDEWLHPYRDRVLAPVPALSYTKQLLQKRITPPLASHLDNACTDLAHQVLGLLQLPAYNGLDGQQLAA